MNQEDFRRLAEDRILDAFALISGQRWSYAYYTAGYAVECALKACVLARMGKTGWIFTEPKVKIDEAFTHSFDKLVRIAGLDNELNDRLKASAAGAPGAGAAPGGPVIAPPGPSFAGYWGVVTRWVVASRYATTSETDARDLLTAITDNSDGILPWLRNYW